MKLRKMYLRLLLFVIVILLSATFGRGLSAERPSVPLPTVGPKVYNVYIPLVGSEPLHALGVLMPLRLMLPLYLQIGPSPTPQPTSTLTPTPALQKPGRSKLGLHVIRNNSPEIMEFVRRTKPRVVKAVGDVGWLSEVKEVSPQTITIGRLKAESQTVTGDPVTATNRIPSTWIGTLALRPNEFV